MEDDERVVSDNDSGEVMIQKTPLPNAVFVRRRHTDGSVSSSTQLKLPHFDGTSTVTDVEDENAAGNNDGTTRTLEIVHSLVLGEDNDPFFFNQDYSVAASTGLTKCWDGSWTVLKLLLSTLSSETGDDSSKHDGQSSTKLFIEACVPSLSPIANRDQTSSSGAPIIIEMGSGSGLVGLTAAYLGAHVLITDVPTVVENALALNIERNTDDDDTDTSSPWPEARAIGKGSVTCAPYDWRRLDPADNEIPFSRPATVILAVECLWLKELLQPFVNASLRLLQLPAGTPPVMYMCARERSTEDSQIFCSPKMAVQAFRDAGCKVTLVLEDMTPPDEEITNDDDNNNNRAGKRSFDDGKQKVLAPVQLYCIQPPS